MTLMQSTLMLYRYRIYWFDYVHWAMTKVQNNE